MKVVGLIDAHSSNPGDAYTHRVLMLLEACRLRGDEVSVLYLQDRGRRRPNFARMWNGPLFREELLRADVIHAANLIATVAAGLAVGNKTPILFDVHGDVPAEAKMLWSDRHTRTDLIDVLSLPWLNRSARRMASGFLVVSTPSQEDYLGYGITPDRIFLVRNGVDLEQFSPTPLPHGNPLMIGYAGSMWAWQGLPLLLSGFEASKTSARLRVIGFSKESRGLENAFRERLADRAELYDSMPRDQMIAMLRACDALALTRPPHQAVRVAMPTKFGEFAALGRPVLVNDVDETADFVRKFQCGWVAKPEPRSIAATIGALATTPPEALDEMGRNARRMAEELFSWDVLRSQYLSAVDAISKS